VHSDVTAAEAEQCVIWSFMLAADLLRIADGTSADLALAALPVSDYDAEELSPETAPVTANIHDDF
jgi:hypothetical protein